ncbi:TDP-fucosamine acetyltransferase [Proteus vulgaris]|uniref:dTDP-4-amino-4,6-dideoxy-D-galactose acyltransferase n=1 Tax=Proteus vulgaris TaxID=585 RepID=UPI000658EB50|nr:dTDP-4-amino-4,6-dideoxy-D-galactose acyltransferase [Proteus vulgaris]WIF72518.1 dTDP-4-amino-4,6-dideoxy-D-galactose acyltransferase [Proteus vulgaris]CRL65815.1 dTDP-fucosamine acetyltransferase [Proteus vulgaris]SUC24766.1 TDP-fucosamine acetyltransferase [Proteus vulgaris]
MSVLANINYLEWESEFFSLKTGRLEFDTQAPVLIDKQLDAFALVQAKVASHELSLIDKLSQLGFQFAEGEIDFKLPIGIENACKKAPELYFRKANDADINLLMKTASEAFVQSRFRAPWYQEGDSSRFYALWVKKAVLGTFDDICLLTYDIENNMSGFVTLRRLSESEARVGLLAVMPNRTGQGIGKQLMSAAKFWCQQQGISTLYVATQISNIAASRLYTHSGGLIESTTYWLYRG